MPRTSADAVETPTDYNEYIDIVIDEEIKTCFTSAYKAKEIGDRLKDNGINWIDKIMNDADGYLGAGDLTAIASIQRVCKNINF